MRGPVTSAAFIVACALVALAFAAPSRTASTLYVYDWDLPGTPAEVVDHVASLGYGGLVTRVKDEADVLKLREYAAHVDTLDGFRLLAYVPYAFNVASSKKVWREILPILAHEGAPLWVTVKNAPSQAAVRDLLLEMARVSQDAGVRTVIYPHWTTDIETAAEASALIAEIGHPNLRNSIHTCHEIRGGNQDVLPDVVALHVDETALVVIAGADADAYAGPPALWVTWDDAIKPLSEGDFSLLPMLQALHDQGYEGPVILQTFGIGAVPGHLEASLAAWADYEAQIVD